MATIYARGVPNAEISAGCARAALREARTKLDSFNAWVRDDVPRMRQGSWFHSDDGRARLAEMRAEAEARVAECTANAARLGVIVQ